MSTTDQNISIEDWLVNMRDGFTEAELDKAFACVQDLTNWKNPIDVVVLPSVKSVSRKQIAAAIVCHTGSVATFTDNADGSYRVEADGYYAAIGA